VARIVRVLDAPLLDAAAVEAADAGVVTGEVPFSPGEVLQRGYHHVAGSSVTDDHDPVVLVVATEQRL